MINQLYIAFFCRRDYLANSPYFLYTTKDASSERHAFGKDKKRMNFYEYKLSEELLKAIDLLHYTAPTKVQQQVIPAFLEKKDVIVKSQTGSGKTASYAIPICELAEWEENKPQALVLVPTRELALQVKTDLFHIGRFKRLKVSVLFGKTPIQEQIKELKQKTHVVVGTPGRIMDHLERETLDLSNIKYLIIDEADEMLRMGFIEQVESILAGLSKNRVTILLSATMPEDIANLSKQYMKEPSYIEIEEDNSALDRIELEKYYVKEEDKISLLQEVTILENPDSCIIFCNTQKSVDEVHEKLERKQYTCQKLHGGMEQRDRTKIMSHFRNGYYRYLVATDVAARGIDIDNISLVINFDVPKDTENFVHRIGRTGRMGKQGRAITFVASNETRYLKDIEEYIGKEILLKEKPEKETVLQSKEEFKQKIRTLPEKKKQKGSELSKEIVKLHINAGRKTKMRPVDIVGTICSIDGVTAEDIGIIQIEDISTFVEILNNKGDYVYHELQKKTIKGRPRKVSKADKRDIHYR